jgi:hypothetical protein
MFSGDSHAWWWYSVSGRFLEGMESGEPAGMLDWR